MRVLLRALFIVARIARDVVDIDAIMRVARAKTTRSRAKTVREARTRAQFALLSSANA
jgi:hypothetical protein